MTNRRHVFISHHFRDDASVDGLVGLLGRAGKDVRNSSIRLKAANAERLERGEVSPRALKRALRMREFGEFVTEAENAFSREHTQWAARRDT